MVHSDCEPNRKGSLWTSARRAKCNIKSVVKLIGFGRLKRTELIA
jgi:hypothetical protein